MHCTVPAGTCCSSALTCTQVPCFCEQRGTKTSQAFICTIMMITNCVVQIPVVLPDLAPDDNHSIQLLVPVNRAGQVHLSARLQYHTSQVSRQNFHSQVPQMHLFRLQKVLPVSKAVPPMMRLLDHMAQNSKQYCWVSVTQSQQANDLSTANNCCKILFSL